jgi:hypothetical protein
LVTFLTPCAGAISWRSELRRVTHLIRSVLTTTRAVRRTRSSLKAQPLSKVQPDLSTHDFAGFPGRGARLAFRVTRATCLERALVLQAWHARRGIDHDVVIGFRKDRGSFIAHAWIDIGGAPADNGFIELTRLTSPARPVPDLGSGSASSA